jgi:hypothetical protein
MTGRKALSQFTGEPVFRLLLLDRFMHRGLPSSSDILTRPQESILLNERPWFVASIARGKRLLEAEKLRTELIENDSEKPNASTQKLWGLSAILSPMLSNSLIVLAFTFTLSLPLRLMRPPSGNYQEEISDYRLTEDDITELIRETATPTPRPRLSPPNVYPPIRMPNPQANTPDIKSATNAGRAVLPAGVTPPQPVLQNTQGVVNINQLNVGTLIIGTPQPTLQNTQGNQPAP